MVEIFQAETKQHIESVRQLFWEYLQWANSRIEQEFSFSFDIAEILENDMASLDKFSPPRGHLLLARVEGKTAGLACMKKLNEDICEVKRMYVREEFRGRGIGRRLLDELLVLAREAGYSLVRLDSARFMHPAHALYRSAGFQDIDPYPESEIPAEYQMHWIFMEKNL